MRFIVVIFFFNQVFIAKTEKKLNRLKQIELRANEVERIRKYEIDTCQTELAELSDKMQSFAKGFQKDSRYSKANNIAGGSRVSKYIKEFSKFICYVLYGSRICHSQKVNQLHLLFNRQISKRKFL